MVTGLVEMHLDLYKKSGAELRLLAVAKNRRFPCRRKRTRPASKPPPVNIIPAVNIIPQMAAPATSESGKQPRHVSYPPGSFTITIEPCSTISLFTPLRSVFTGTRAFSPVDQDCW